MRSKLKNNYDIVSESIKSRHEDFLYAGEKIKNDKKSVEKLITINPLIVRYLSKKFLTKHKDILQKRLLEENFWSKDIQF